MRRRVGILTYSDVQALDVAGPMDAFTAASVMDGTGKSVPAYEVFTVASSRETHAAESGLLLKPQHTFETCPEMDTLVIPGGCGIRDPAIAGRLLAWVARGAW